MTRAAGWLLTAVLLGSPAVAAPAARPAAAVRADFPTRILPLLTKAGCNSGTCHGAAIGQGGLRLSLLGYDPEADHAAIARELGGRRLQLAAAEESLLLRKASGNLPHGGGVRLAKETGAYRQLRDWISAGAPYGEEPRRITTLEVNPKELLLPAPGGRQALRVVARFSDGSQEEVTPLALYSADDEAVASVDDAGIVTVTGHGLSPVLVRYLGLVAAVRAGSPYSDRPSSEPFPAARGPVDPAVFSELRRLRLPLSPRSADDEFLRRLYLDLLGVLPTPEEVRAFLQDRSAGKRERTIEALLARPEFTDYWTLQWAELLRIDSKRLGAGPASAYHRWLRTQIEQNRPLSEVVRELLTAAGDAGEHGPVNFYRAATDPRDLSEIASRSLLGVRLECARCHNHPFDRWTQDDYYGFAAFFARVRFNGSQLVDLDRGELEHPKTGEPVAPRLLGEVEAVSVAERRPALAQWLLSGGNERLARNLANRVWKRLLGRGIVEPVDDLRVSNPPTNPALLEALTRELTTSGYDLRRLVRTIVSSRTYQSSSRAVAGNERDDRFFSHALVRPLPPEVLADGIAQATGVPEEYAGYPAGTRAVQLVDGRVPSETLDALGRCRRETGCEPGALQGGLRSALHLINGDGINARVASGIAARLLQEGRPDREIVEELYLRTLCRFPEERERAHWADLLARAPARRERVEDLLWALLSSREFAFNH
ncbi:MAG: DUF1549 and DUF1553 domain-containing protein [Armatimonadota bacterium]